MPLLSISLYPCFVCALYVVKLDVRKWSHTKGLQSQTYKTLHGFPVITASLLRNISMIRNLRASHRSQGPYQAATPRSSRASKYGDIVQADAEVVDRLNSNGKKAARDFNQKRVADILRELFPRPSSVQWKTEHRTGHSMGRPILNVGATTGKSIGNMGRWLQIVSYYITLHLLIALTLHLPSVWSRTVGIVRISLNL